jgi:hypothetical protein
VLEDVNSKGLLVEDVIKSKSQQYQNNKLGDCLPLSRNLLLYPVIFKVAVQHVLLRYATYNNKKEGTWICDILRRS